MSKVYRVNRKATDEDIIKMNAVGLSLATIAKTLGIHPTTVTLRLRSLNIEPADTRRTFMENVLTPLPTHVVDWLAEQVGPQYEIRSYVRDLLMEAYNNRHQYQESAHERFLKRYSGTNSELVSESSTKPNE